VGYFCRTALVNHASTLRADALTEGNAGKVIVWSDQRTEFYGNVSARGGSLSGNGGLMEVSGKNELVFAGMADAGATNGQAGQLLLDPKNIIIDDSVSGRSFQLLDPNPNAGNRFGSRAVLSDGNIVVSSPFDDLIATDTGAVYLFNPDTGALLGSINGANANDRFGSNAITALLNSNYVFGNPFADIGGNVNAGTVILANGTNGAEISRINGANADDNFGSNIITPLPNGNYVFGNPNADIGGISDAGTVILANGTTGAEINRINGANASDRFGSNAITTLPNDNYVFGNPNADIGGISDAGTVILANGTTGAEINRINGANASDHFGNGAITTLPNDNYVFGNPNADINGITDTGTVILASGITGLEISRINGTLPNDNFGSGAITALPNRRFSCCHYVFGNPNADINGITNAGTVILADNTGEIKRISGAFARDNFGSNAITALANGNYVFGNAFADIDGNTNAGTVILANGTTGAEISRISGTNAGDRFGGRYIPPISLPALLANPSSAITALPNGNYVFGNSYADINGITNAGTVILANGTTGAEINRINGPNAGDYFGSNAITALANGNYVFGNPFADIGRFRLVIDIDSSGGTVILANGTTGAEINRINGPNANDNFGSGAITPLSNGNYLVASPSANSNAGRVDIGISNPNSLTYGYFPDRNITINPRLITQVTNTGTGVTLQANTDITVNSRIISFNPTGNGGNLTFQAGRSILVNAPIITDNGNLTLIANDTRANGVVNAQREPGQAVISIAPGATLNSGTGDTTLILGTGEGLTNNASGEITASNIITAGGDITLINNRGGINTSTGILSTGSGATGGNIRLEAAGNIITKDINSSSTLNNGGTINLTSGGDISTGIFNASGNATGGNITLSAAGNLTTKSIISGGENGKGGEIRLRSGDDITTGILSSLSNSSGGEITLQATGNITTESIFSSGQNGNGENISLKSGGDITAGILNALGTNTGGNIALQAEGNITSNSILSSGGNGNGGVINLNSGGSINVINDSITNLSGISSLSGNGNGGDITFNAATSINTGSLPLFSSAAIGNGGNITLNAATGDIEVAGINTEGGGTGGSVDITTTQFFRATDSFRTLNDTTASISTSGVTAGGTIIIRHGGRGVTPFKVGDAATNGTDGAITTGNLLRAQTISPTASFLNTHTQDGIQIISVPGQTLPPPSPPLGSLRPSDSDGSPQDTLAALVGDIVGVKTSVNQDPLTGNSSYAWQIPGVGSLNTGRINLANLLAQGNLNNAISAIDDLFESEYEEYLGENIAGEKVSIESIRNTLKTIKDETGTNPVIIYAISLPEQLELVLVLPEGPPIHKVIPAANATALQQTLTEFRATVTDRDRPTAYLDSAQRLYSWMIAPVESQLKSLGIDTLIFSMDAGLRTIPMAALHDGKQFLVEKYSLGSIPSVSLTNSRYKAVKDTRVLAMGASKFQQLDPLPAVPEELKAISQQFGSEKYFLNEEFTLTSLKNQRQQQPIEIIHLATHAHFQEGDGSNSYIQLWDSQLRLDQLRQLGWNQPPQIELLVLSACETAVGDAQVELGFAGLAVQAGVKSALASLWSISDGGTLALMSEFYRQLKQPDVTIKAEALRRAQLAMLRGQLHVESGQLRGIGVVGTIPLPPELPGNQDFSHPYYWAAFTIIGSPW